MAVVIVLASVGVVSVLNLLVDWVDQREQALLGRCAWLRAINDAGSVWRVL